MPVEAIDYKKAYEEAQAQIAHLSEELERLQEQLKYYMNGRYGRKTEQIQNTNQITF